MMLNVKKLLAYILDSINHKALRTTWSSVSTTAGAYTTVKTFTLKANSVYLVLATGRNGLTTNTGNTINFTCPNAAVLEVATGYAASGAGNPAFSWAYVETGSAQRTLNIQAYGYASGETSTGHAVAIRLVGGGTS